MLHALNLMFQKKHLHAALNYIFQRTNHLHVAGPGAEWDEGRGGEVAIGIDNMDWMVCLINTITTTTIITSPDDYWAKQPCVEIFITEG